MAPFYEQLCSQFDWSVDASFMQKMKAKNEEKVKELDSAVEDAEKNLGETEVRDFMLKKAEYFSRIGDKVRCSSCVQFTLVHFDKVSRILFSYRFFV